MLWEGTDSTYHVGHRDRGKRETRGAMYLLLKIEEGITSAQVYLVTASHKPTPKFKKVVIFLLLNCKSF